MSTLELTKVTGLATVQDGGRHGHLHEGVPPGGALVPEALGRANAAAGNQLDAAGLELFGALRGVAHGGLRLGFDDGRALDLGDGQTFELSCGGARVVYLALRGGLDVPRVLGGRSTLLQAGLGGHEGRALRAGDRLEVATTTEVSCSPPVASDPAAPLRVVPGPDLGATAEALEGLLESTFLVDARSDRVGIRLGGPRLPRSSHDLGPSRPMVRGAIQLPSDGMPIVLGPDHPTTGGYPVVATIVQADLGRLGALPVGAAVRFVARFVAAPSPPARGRTPGA